MTFDYSLIPKGYYDSILHGDDGVRKFWHYHKFESVLRYIPNELKGRDKKILDVGCFAGSFLGLIPEETFGVQRGIDILPEQIEFANARYGTFWREFSAFDGDIHASLDSLERFDVITLIEVVEHLNAEQIYKLLKQIQSLLLPGGCLIITTPNYLSFWPLLEVIVNMSSSVKYEEQHLTKFTYINLDKKMKTILKEIPFYLEEKTTSHFLTPFVAGINYKFAERLATGIPSANWKNPFGNIILSRWRNSNP